MSYTLTTTSGNVLTTIQDGTTNTQFGLTLIGRDYTGYGSLQNENFVKLLENFADPTPPNLSSLALTPLPGTLWYDTQNNLLKIYDGANWNPVSQQIVSDTVPTATNTGDQWYDTVNQQLHVWTGASWLLVGPAYTASQGLSGVVIGTIVDSLAVPHTVSNTYVAGNLVSITSGSTFAPAVAIPGFSNIKAGVNISSNVIVNGTTANSTLFNGIAISQVARTDAPATFASDVSVAGNVHLTNANIGYASNALSLKNYAYYGNVDVTVNSVVGNITALHVDGGSGLVSLYADPVNPKHAATKQYVDVGVASMVDDVQNVANQFYANITALQNDYLSNVNVINNEIAVTNTSISALHTLLDSNIASLSASATARFDAATANAASQQSNITAINTYLDNLVPTLAPLASPVLTGVPTSTSSIPALQNYINSFNIYSQNIVLDNAVSVNVGDYLTQLDPDTFVVISNLRVANAVSSGTVVAVNLIAGTVQYGAGPVLTKNGPSTLVSAHITSFNRITTGQSSWGFMGLGDTSTRIATTAYVDYTANVIYGDYVSRINTEAAARNAAIAIATAPLANIASPAFTGTPTAPTPAVNDNSTKVATTAYVSRQIEAQKFNYTVSTSGPSGGNNGDFWFRIG